jgi:hypothetical protein
MNVVDVSALGDAREDSGVDHPFICPTFELRIA